MENNIHYELMKVQKPTLVDKEHHCKYTGIKKKTKIEAQELANSIDAESSDLHTRHVVVTIKEFPKMEL